MGNIVNKNTNYIDTCYEYIINNILKEQDYKLVKNDKYMSILSQDLYKKVLVINDIYITLLEDNTEFQRLLLTPFISGLCKNKNLDNKSAIDNFIKNKYILFAGFSRMNFCKMISFATCDVKFNSVFDKEVPYISILCAFHSMEVDTDNKQRTIGLGSISLYKMVEFLFIKGYEYVTLSCTKDLIEYYRKLGFKLGSSSRFDYTDLYKKLKLRYTHKKLKYILYDIIVQSHNDATINENMQINIVEGSDYDLKNILSNINYSRRIPEDTLYKMFLHKDRINKLKDFCKSKLYSIEHNEISENFFDTPNRNDFLEGIKISDAYNASIDNHNIDIDDF